MAKATKTDDKPKTDQAAPQQAPAAQLPAAVPLRLPYPRSMQEWAGYDQRDWQVLTDVIFPLANTANAIILAVEYCRSRKLDIMKKVVHIVPMRRKKPNTTNDYEMVDTIWPGIAEVRITATRTGIYAGKDAAVFGTLVKKKFQHIDTRGDEPRITKEEEAEFPEWCRVDVYKIVQGIRCKFEGPKVYWEEAYATESFFSEIPNEMWKSRKSGQLEKCAEAASLRAAFPEELGGEYTAEEMHGRTLDAKVMADGRYSTGGAPAGTMTPPRPKQSEFQREPESEKKPDAPAPQPAEKGQQQPSQSPDGRPEPPPHGEEVQRETVASDPAPKPQAEPVVVTENENQDPPEETEPSEAYMGICNWLDETGATIADEADLESFKKRGRGVIDAFEGLTEDERDMVRGKFTTLVLTEQQRRAKKKK